MQKLRVGVLMGGKGIEREVSFNSGRTICDHLDTARYQITPLFQTKNNQLYILPWHFLHRGKTNDFEHRLQHEAQHIIWDELKNSVDFIYIAMHGRYAEDGTLQGFLEVLGIPYLGSGIFGSALGMDKIMQRSMLQAHSIETPRGITVYPYHINEYAQHRDAIMSKLSSAQLTLPLVIKPHKEGSSLGVSIIHDWNQLENALHEASSIHPGKQQAVIIEEKINGMEFSCICITDYKTGRWIALPPTEVVADQKDHIFNYEQKYMPGKAIEYTPARCNADMITNIQDMCIATTHALEFKTISRIDGFVTPDNRVVIVDPNSLSGMSPTSFLFREAALINMSHTQLINHLIETDLHSYGMLSAIIKQEKEQEMLQPTKKLRVAVLMGGNTNEREISLESGRNVVYKLSPQKYEPIPLFVNEQMELFHLNQQLLVRNSTKEIAELVTEDMKVTWSDLPQIADFVFIGLHGGLGENGGVQGTLEMLDMPYNGSSVLASALCMDKYKTTQFLKHQGFEVPQSMLLSKDGWLLDEQRTLTAIMSRFTFPLIVKPHDDGCSVMVHKTRDEQQLADALHDIFNHAKEHVLIEEWITGMELTVGVIGNDRAQALPPSQAVYSSDILSIEEKFLPGAGENQTPAPLPAESLRMIQDTIARAYEAVGCKGYARIDCFYQTAEQSPTKQERVVVLEFNTLPGLTPATCIFHQAAEIGIKPMDFIDLIITLGLQEHKSEIVVDQQLIEKVFAK
jgi:D-alanine-D-alanine ligase